MKILSIRQPWAYLISSGSKNIENRTWPTKYRGLFLVHASLNINRVARLDPSRAGQSQLSVVASGSGRESRQSDDGPLAFVRPI